VLSDETDKVPDTVSPVPPDASPAAPAAPVALICTLVTPPGTGHALQPAAVNTVVVVG
jgi:hypothetical protein